MCRDAASAKRLWDESGKKLIIAVNVRVTYCNIRAAITPCKSEQRQGDAKDSAI